jgi:hypothetical protein
VAGLRFERRQLRRACRSDGGHVRPDRGEYCTHAQGCGDRLEQQRFRCCNLELYSGRDVSVSSRTQLNDDNDADVEHHAHYNDSDNSDNDNDNDNGNDDNDSASSFAVLARRFQQRGLLP